MNELLFKESSTTIYETSLREVAKNSEIDGLIGPSVRPATTDLRNRFKEAEFVVGSNTYLQMSYEIRGDHGQGKVFLQKKKPTAVRPFFFFFLKKKPPFKLFFFHPVTMLGQ